MKNWTLSLYTKNDSRIGILASVKAARNRSGRGEAVLRNYCPRARVDFRRFHAVRMSTLGLFWVCIPLFLASSLFGKIAEDKNSPQPTIPQPQGWSFDIGGSYTWMTFSTPPTYSGSTGGVLGKITYQMPDAFFGQARSFYNIGPLSSSINETSFQESYSEFVGGYCISALKNWTITPYAGLGLDFLFDDHTGYDSISPIDLQYTIYYAVAGFKTHYAWQNWMLGLQLDCLPTFNQYLKIEGLSGAAWTLKNRTGVEVQLPFAYRYAMNYWLEVAPYFRFLPIGKSSTLGLSARDLNEWGAFVSLRFFL